MKLIALEIPDDATALPGWLEQHLVGADLGALVAELEAVHGSTAQAVALAQVLGKHRDDVLTRGLATLSINRLRQLLRQPRLLLDLQELILISGGPHWSRLASSVAEHQPAVERGWRALAATLGAEAAATQVGPTQPEAAARSRPGRSPWHRLGWILGLAAIAAALFVVLVVERGRRGEPGPNVTETAEWGWSRPGALPQDLGRSEYLHRLADAAHEWFNKRPEDRLALTRRLAEFRQGCSSLLQVQHRPLSTEDRAWLIDRCRAWAAKFDGYLAAIQSGEAPRTVRDQADATVEALIKALGDRARGEA